VSSHVFISYSKKDGAYVKRLAKWLETAGVPVWFDASLDYGDTWTQVIEEKLDTCDAVIVVMSPESRNSTWVSREVTRAERKGKRVFPILLSGDPFLQFETTQYENVSGGALPSPQFADSLAVHLKISLRALGSDLLETVQRYRQSGVLVLGRFSGKRQQTLKTLQNALRSREYTPLLFDFTEPLALDLSSSLLLLALSVRFIVADLTEAKTIVFELEQIVPHAISTPVQPILAAGHPEFAMFKHFRRYPHVLPTLLYKNADALVANIGTRMIEPVNDCIRKLEEDTRRLRRLQ
jgi:hypothetical protein